MSGTSHSDLGSGTRTCPIIVGDNSPSRSFVYFISAGGRIKIGYTVDLQSRFAALNLASPADLSIIGTVMAPRRLESALHRLLAKHRIKGEWFADCAEVREAIDAALDGRIDGLLAEAKTLGRPSNDHVVWASRSLRELAAPLERGEPIRQIIERAAERAGLSYWRAFDLWYGKARRLEINERDAIAAAVEARA